MPPRPQGMSALRWLLARMLSLGQPVRFIYQPPNQPAGLRVIHMYDQDGYHIGQFVWQVCRACQGASINKISISDPWQLAGIRSVHPHHLTFSGADQTRSFGHNKPIRMYARTSSGRSG